MKTPLWKTIRYALEAMLVYALFTLFRALSPTKASDLGGWLGRTIGTRLAANRKARANIALAFPDLDHHRQDAIICGMWDNLGRVVAEYPHLETLSTQYTTVKGGEILNDIHARGLPAIFFGGHLANWEVNGAATLLQLGYPVELTYRKPNNPWTASLLEKARTLNGRLIAHPKSSESGRKIIQTIKNGGFLGILIDQKYNEGLKVDFFDAPAMTNPAFVTLCQKYRCPLVPIRAVRENTCHFTLNIYDPIALFDAQGNPLPVEDVIKQAHDLLEGWIRERPQEWLWLHRRWGNPADIQSHTE